LERIFAVQILKYLVFRECRAETAAGTECGSVLIGKRILPSSLFLICAAGSSAVAALALERGTLLIQLGFLALHIIQIAVQRAL